MSSKNKLNGKNILNTCVELLEDKHVSDMKAYDVRKISSITDFCLVGSVNNNRQMKAAGDNLTRQLKKMGVRPLHKAGESDNTWVVLDYIDCIVHLFMPETREYYYIEQMWEKHEIPIKNSTENEQTRSKK